MKARYVPDLTKLMAECEANYARLLKLMPDMSANSRRIFGVTFKQHNNVRICLEVVEHFKYTATLKLNQQNADFGCLNKPDVLIRIYHDVRMAEVIEPDRARPLRGSYSYPNARMYQRDEKVQRNLFLGELLRQCLSHGYAVEALNLVKAS